MVKKRKRKKTKITKKSNAKDPEVKEYGVVLTKDEKYRHRIYPQKGKIPEEDEDYKIVWFSMKSRENLIHKKYWILTFRVTS